MIGKLSESELEQLKAHALEASPGVCAVEARELLELISGYRRRTVPICRCASPVHATQYDAEVSRCSNCGGAVDAPLVQMLNALEEKLGGPVELVETSWDRKEACAATRRRTGGT